MRERDTTADQRDQASLAEDLRTLLSAFSCRWLMILLIILAFLGLGLLYVWASKPGYTAGADIFIDPRERNLVDLNVAPSGLGSSSQGADNALLESQIAILTSHTILTKLVENEKLTANPEFAGGGEGIGSTVRAFARTLIYGPNAGEYGQMTPLDRTLQKLSRNIQVKRVGQTYVLNVSVTTGSAQLSARLANALANLYLSEGQSAVDSNALESARSLEGRLEELRKASEASQKAVEAYRRDHGLIGAEGTLTDERQLADLNTQLVTATIASRQARAALDESRRSGVSGATSILSSDLANQLRMQLDQARSEESVLSGTYGARHPRLAQARQNRQSLEKALDAELTRVQARAESDYKKATATEASLRALVAQYQDRMAGANAASIKLRELEQAAERNRSLYDTFSTRAKQAREQIALPSTTARILSPAEPPSRPSEPKVATILAASLFLGAVTAFGTAWLLYLLVGPPRRRPRRRDRWAALSRQRYSDSWD